MHPKLLKAIRPMPPTRSAIVDTNGVATRLRPATTVETGASATAAPGRKEKFARPARILLGTEQSAASRERLLASLGQLQSADEAADWVHANLAAKNTLIAADADRVESGFRDRLAAIDAASSCKEDPQSAPAEGIASPAEKPFLAPTDDPASAAIILPAGPGAATPTRGGEDDSPARQGAL